MQQGLSAATTTMLKFLLLLLCCTVSTVVLGADRIRVFVSIPPQKQFVEKIGGDHVEVRVMMPPGQSPETFSPSPRMMTALSGAKLYFRIGVPFEQTWMDAIQSVSDDIRIVSCCEQLIAEGADVEKDDHDDLHIWTSPAYVMLLAKDIRDELVRTDPGNRPDYEANYRKFIEELEVLDDSIHRKLQGRRTDYFIASHAAWGYFAEQYGLVQLAMEKNGKESGPRSLREMILLAQQHGIRVLFAQEQYKTPYLRSLARELQAEIVELDPLAEDYLANMQIVSERIAMAVR